MKSNILLITSLFIIQVLFAQVPSYRYSKYITTSVSKTNNFTYRTAAHLNSPYVNENSTTSSAVTCDIYRPTGDTFTNRPAVIVAHAGAFALGSKNNLDVKDLCDSLARKGYVAISINYRKGYSILDNVALHSTRAVYRAIQDGKAAVRYFRANASTYGIDASKVYWVGSSAGAIIGLNSVYLDDSERPTETQANTYSVFGIPYSAPDLGSVNVGANLTENGTPNAVVAMWGGLASTGMIQADENTPVFLIHGSADTTVPYNSGNPFGYSAFPIMYGSNAIYPVLQTHNIKGIAKYFVSGEGHEFHGYESSNNAWANGTGGNAYWEEITDRIFAFLRYQHKPVANFFTANNGMSVTFLNKSNANTFLYWDFGDGTIATSENPNHTYATAGSYTVTLYVENTNKSWDEISRTIEVSASYITQAGTLVYDEVSNTFNGFNGTQWTPLH